MDEIIAEMKLNDIACNFNRNSIQFKFSNVIPIEFKFKFN